MFTKEDYKVYFEEIAMTELMMICRAQEIISSVKDPSVINPLKGIVDDEVRHYLAVMGMIDKVLLKLQIDQGTIKREFFLGDARLKSIISKREFSGYCVKVLEKAICVECPDALPENEEFEIWVNFYDGSASIHIPRGSIKWSVKVRQISCIAGIGRETGQSKNT